MASLLRSLINGQRALCRAFDNLLPADYSTDGNYTFGAEVIPSYLQPGVTIVDVGGGRGPCLTLDDKERLGVTLVGIDIDGDELSAAPAGLYDKTHVSDVGLFEGSLEADVIVCRAVLEHVENVELAFATLSRILKAGGKILIFVPSRNACFARLNLALPEALKRKLLYSIEPGTEDTQGFPSYYDRCTPSGFRKLARAHDLRVLLCRPFYQSTYFCFFFPLYFVWKLWIVLFRTLCGEQAAETFVMILTKD